MDNGQRTTRGFGSEAAAELLIPQRTWLLREDFLQVAVEVEWEPFRGREVAVVDFAAAAEAVQGVLPCSGGFSELAICLADLPRCDFF